MWTFFLVLKGCVLSALFLIAPEIAPPGLVWAALGCLFAAVPVGYLEHICREADREARELRAYQAKTFKGYSWPEATHRSHH